MLFSIHAVPAVARITYIIMLASLISNFSADASIPTAASMLAVFVVPTECKRSLLLLSCLLLLVSLMLQRSLNPWPPFLMLPLEFLFVVGVCDSVGGPVVAS